jgi:membrane protein
VLGQDLAGTRRRDALAGPWLRAVAAYLRRVAHLSALSAWRGLVGFYESDDLVHAAAIAYYGLLSLFPFSMLVFAILGSVAADDSDRAALLDFVLRYFPAQFEFITRQLDELARSAIGFGVFGTVLLVWGALGVFGAIATAVNHAWGVEQVRSFWRHRAFSFLMLVVAGLVFLAALLLVSASKVVGTTWFARSLLQFPGLELLRSFGVGYATTLLVIIVLGLVYYFVPNAKVRFRDVWVGAVVTGVLWTLTLHGFTWLMGDMSRLTRVNGSIAAVVVFLTWIYMQAVVLLYGAEFTAAYSRIRRGRPDEAPAAPAPR